jgi:hypothetical protein
MKETEILNELLALAEQSYIRVEAEQLIAECLRHEDESSFEELIESLVLMGASSINVLREILEEIQSEKSDLSREGFSVRQDLMEAFNQFGLHLPELLTVEVPEAFNRICSEGLALDSRGTENFIEKEDETLLQAICIEAGARARTLARRLALLNNLERSVRGH